ncbi:hypothetical protein F2P56_021495, partial [Juglans regia]
LDFFHLLRRSISLAAPSIPADFAFPVCVYNMRASVNRPPTPDVGDTQEKQPTLEEIINIKFIESGEKERLMELLRERLIECGWKDEMKALCRAFVKKKGRNNVTVDDLVHLITPKGRASIPDSIKAELLQRIRTFLVSAAL